jgi:hypothetical protein
MKDLAQKFRGSLPANSKKREVSHPDFAAKITAWGTVYSAAAWLGTTKKDDLYIALSLTSDEGAQTEKLKLPLWRNHDRQSASDPHFRAVQEIFGHDFTLQGWLLPAGDNYRLEITIEPIDADGGEVSDAALDTRERIASFLAEVGGPALPPAPKTAGLPAPPLGVDEEPADIPF